jgi:hypothetical protein
MLITFVEHGIVCDGHNLVNQFQLLTAFGIGPIDSSMLGVSIVVGDSRILKQQ